MKDTLILKDGTIIELEAGASLGALQVVSANREAMVATWAKFTEDNLAEVQIKASDGTVVGTHTDLVLVSEMSIVRPDSTILTSYCLREKTAEQKRLDALEEGQEVQDGAITELAAMAGGEA